MRPIGYYNQRIKELIREFFYKHSKYLQKVVTKDSFTIHGLERGINFDLYFQQLQDAKEYYRQEAETWEQLDFFEREHHTKLKHPRHPIRQAHLNGKFSTYWDFAKYSNYSDIPDNDAYLEPINLTLIFQ